MDQMDSVMEIDAIPMEIWEEMAKEGADSSVTVNTRGISMWPLLRNSKDAVKIVYPRRKLMVGDIIMFHRADGTEIAHRICWMDDEKIQTIGDNCSFCDKKIPHSSVVGLITDVRRRGHWIHVDTSFWRFYGKFMIWSNPFRMFIRNKMYRPLRKLARRIIKGS